MQIVSTCLARDLSIYRITYQSLRQHIPGCEIHVITKKEDFPKFKKACGPELFLWDESALVPEMTLGELRNMPLSFFPKGAGWYFQQFLKYAFINVSNDDEYYLIWDADTVLLRPMQFFAPDGRPYYTRASEHHRPYFQTFNALFGEAAPRDFSFISQHQVIHKKTLRSMFAEIEIRHPDSRNWAWAIMDNLQGEGSNCFSEYETYGHYLKLRKPDDLAVRSIEWLRNGTSMAGYPPSKKMISKLAANYSFAAFEAGHTRTRILWHKIVNRFKK